MRALYLGSPSESVMSVEQHRQWVHDAIQTIEQASHEDADVSVIAQDFTISNYTETRTLNAGTATLADLANVVATFIDDIKARGRTGVV